MRLKTDSRLFSTVLGLALLIGAILSCVNPAAAGETAVVASGPINVRNGPGTDYGIITQAYQGDQLAVLGQSTGWYNVALAGGGQGWVAGWLVNIQQSQDAGASAGQVAVLNGNGINVRGGPGTNYGIVTQGGLGDCFPVLESSGDWVKVQLSSGTGWVAGWLVSLEGAQPGSSQPAAGDPAPATGGGGSQVALVSGTIVNVRSGPGTANAVVGTVVQGNSLPVLSQSGDWLQVSLPSGASGWVAGWLVSLEDVQPSQPAAGDPAPVTGGGGSQVALVNGTIVNVRSGPGTANAVVGTVVQGNSLPVLSRSGDWLQVSLPSGGSGWVAGWLVALNDVSPGTTQPQDSGNEVSRGGDRSDDVPDDTTAGKLLSMNVQKTVSDQTAFAIKADVPVSYNSFFLSNPDRLVIDIQGVSPGDLPSTKNVSAKTVSKVRSGYFQKNPDVTRLVFELSGEAQYEVSLSGDQKTLNVDTYIPKVDGSYNNRIIVLDPGHGGPDPGAIGQNGTQEKAVTLDIAKRVSKLLGAKGAKVIMARSADTDVSLDARTNIANKNKADIFVSIHINAHTDPSIGGTTTYIYSGTGSSSETPRLQESDKLARSIQTELIKSLGLRDIGVKSANFAVVRTSNMPAVLIELAFISNAAEEKLLNTDSFKNKAAEAIVKGIGSYFSQKRTA